MLTREQILQVLQGNLSPRRMRHSLGAEQEARALAELHGADAGKAALAGLVHDCAKALPAPRQAELARRTAFAVDADALAAPQILHAPAGAAYAREKLGITDSEVLDAICWHTVPRVDMTLLDIVVFVADLTEPQRSFPGVDELRATARRDLPGAYLQALGRCIAHAALRLQPVHPLSLRAYNELARGRRV